MITILRSSNIRKVVAGQSGYHEVELLCQFSTTDLTGTVECPFSQVFLVLTTSIGGGLLAAGPVEQAQIGSISATSAVNIMAPKAGAIAGVLFTTLTAVTANDTSFWTFGLVNKTQTLTPVNSATAANSTKATGGSSLVGYTPLALTLAVAAQLVVTQGDVLEFTVTKASSATTMAESTVMILFSSNGDELVVCDDLAQVADGVIQRESAGTLTFSRRVANPTSNLVFSVLLRGNP